MDIGIVIPLKEEFTEFHKAIGRKGIELETELEVRTSTYYYKFEYFSALLEDSYSCVAVFIGEMGPDDAGLFTERIINHWQPETIILVGIAASIDDSVRLGDIVIANSVDNYLKAAKAVGGVDDHGFDLELSGSSFGPSYDLVQLAANFEFAFFENYLAWQDSCRNELKKQLAEDEIVKLIAAGPIRDAPRISLGHLASGDIVGATEAFVKWLKKRDRKYLALEMEAAGVMNAIYKRTDPTRSLVLRAISDYADERKKELDETGKGLFRRYAMNNALELLWQLLDVAAFPRSNEKKGALEAKMARPRAPTRVCPSAPRLPNEFTGREEQIKQLTTLLRKDTEPNNIAIHGMAGIGKTVLAYKIAQVAMKDLDFKAVLCAKVTSNPNLNLHLADWADYAVSDYHLPKLSDSQKVALHVKALLNDLIKEKCPGRVLVILDEVWEEGEGIEVAENLMHAAPENAVILVTTQSEEVAQRLRCSVVFLPPMSGEESRILLRSLLKKGKVTEDQIQKVALLLDGHALALLLTIGNLNETDDIDIGALLEQYERGLSKGNLSETGMAGGRRKEDMSRAGGK